MLGRRGQATAIGGVFFVLLMVALLGLIFYQIDYEHRFHTKSIEVMEERKRAYTERIKVSENYTITRNYAAADVATFTVLEGDLVSGNNSSLNDIGVNYIIVDSDAVFNLTVPGGTTTTTSEAIKNGEFNYGLDYWIYVNGVGSWNTSTYINGTGGLDTAAIYSTIVSGGAVDNAKLYQSFTVGENLKSAELSFNYRMWWELCPFPLPREYIFNLFVFIDNNAIGTYSLTCNEWKSISAIDVTDYLTTPGNHTLEFRIYIYNPNRWLSFSYKVWIDKVSLKLTYIDETAEFSSVVYGIDAMLDLDMPDYYNLTYKLLTQTNISLILDVYAFDEENNIWVLYDKFLTVANEWSNITLDSPRIRIYAESQHPFRIQFDYLYVETTELNPNGFTLIIENAGDYDLEIVACWLKNETLDALRYEVGRSLLPGERLEVNIPVVLTKGSLYQVRVVTRNNVFKHSFTP